MTEPIYTDKRQARKYKRLPKAARSAIRKRSAYRRIERTLKRKRAA